MEDPSIDILAKPLPATLAIKYDFTGPGYVCLVNIQLGSHQDTPESALAGSDTLRYIMGRLTQALEVEMKMMQKQDKEQVH